MEAKTMGLDIFTTKVINTEMVDGRVRTTTEQVFNFHRCSEISDYLIWTYPDNRNTYTLVGEEFLKMKEKLEKRVKEAEANTELLFKDDTPEKVAKRNQGIINRIQHDLNALNEFIKQENLVNEENLYEEYTLRLSY